MARERNHPDLEEIEVGKVLPNPSNPRGPNVRDNDKHFEYLKNSIQEHGLLVPLVVVKRGDEYLLVDGERRLYALRAVRARTAPAYVLAGNLDDHLIRTLMFHIHTNRTPWDPKQQCRALEPLYQRLVSKHGRDAAREIADEISDATGTPKRTALNRAQFLCWPKDIKDEIYESEETEPYWYVVEIESRIVEPARRNFPSYFQRVEVDDVRKFLYRKYTQGEVLASTEVRKAAVLTKYDLPSGDKKKAQDIFARLVDEVGYSFDQAQEDFFGEFPRLRQEPPVGPRALRNKIQGLADLLSEYEASYLTPATGYSVDLEEMIDALDALRRAIEEFKQKLDEPTDTRHA